MNFSVRAEQLEEHLIRMRRHLHENPELSFEEKETTAFIEQELKDIGIETHRIGNMYGVWADIKGPVPGKTVLLRADIDALPIREQTGLPFASRKDGIMHACGHDTHTAMLLTAARMLYEKKEELKGTVRLLFQAAEESCHGAEYYVKAGLLDDVDAVYGSHVWAPLEAPYINVQSGPRMSSCDNFTITVYGKAAHGASPELGTDAIAAAASVICQIQNIVSRQTDPRDSLVITIGEITGGTRFNVIADRVVMKGTVRTHSTVVRGMVEERLRRVCRAAAETCGARAELEYDYYPGVLVNDPELTAIAAGSAVKLFGPEALREEKAGMGSEDFSYFLEKVPGVYVLLGIRNEKKGLLPQAHNPFFCVDESVLKRGAALYAQFAVDYLSAASDSPKA